MNDECSQRIHFFTQKVAVSFCSQLLGFINQPDQILSSQRSRTQQIVAVFCCDRPKHSPAVGSKPYRMQTARAFTPLVNSMTKQLLLLLSVFTLAVEGRLSGPQVAENMMSKDEHMVEADSSILVLVAGVTITLVLVALYIIKVVTETEEPVYSSIQSPNRENEIELKVVKDGEGATSDNEPRSDTSLAYATTPSGEARAKEERWRQILSIPTVFAGAVLFFIAVIAISTTLLSFFAQKDMVNDLTGQIQNSISTNFLSQTNATLGQYTNYAREIKMFSSYYIPLGSPLPDANISSITSYREIVRYMVSSVVNREIGIGCGITFSNSKGFGAGNEVYGVNVYDTFNISGTLYTWVSLLNSSLSLDYPQPDPNPLIVIPVQYYSLTAAPCPTGYPTEFWGPLQPTIIGPNQVDNSLIRFIRTCYQEQLTFLTTVTIKFGTISSLLQQMVSQVKGKAFIVEANGALVASTTNTKPYALSSTGSFDRYFAENCTDQYIRQAWDIYQKNPTISQTTHGIDGVDYFLLPTRLDTGDGISWIIIHLAESDPFLARINVYVRRTGIIIGVVCAAAVILAILASFWITRPFTHLTQQLQKAAKMQLTEKEISEPFLFEARRIHQAFITMREAMKSFQRYIPEALIKTRMDYKDLRNLVEVGAGAFGIVYRAEWNGENVAVKQVKTEFVSDVQMQEFLSEVSILEALLPHPNLVLFKAATFPPQPLSMITEFCDGGSLYAYVRKYPNLALAEKLRLLTEISKGMHHLHKQKVVHRDLALRNILLSSELQAKVSDFGMSRATASEDGSTTTAIVGPLKWMAPEAITQNKYSTKSDVYSFGILIWELFEEKDPYPGLQPVEAAVQVVEGLRPVFTQCPPWLVELSEACWGYAPEHRPNFKRITQAISAEGLSNQIQEDDEEEKIL
ncbi:serine/threonine-protein kinase HT1-like [Planoprotostelium fungivorum]|uniref:Serine/threonine-protein kinase HT1-like n=1 Tax=Planoprotostelium fungivorum TaxID=1890364 RepID=A0A2P6NQM5_9EUKA|nr:serine/threonine-protein kinase HT1-like [Planoprotostelium fungivorum]